MNAETFFGTSGAPHRDEADGVDGPMTVLVMAHDLSRGVSSNLSGYKPC